MTGPVRRIVGREHELEVLLAAIDAVGSAGSAIAVCGEPGIGKSVLLQAGRFRRAWPRSWITRAAERAT